MAVEDVGDVERVIRALGHAAEMVDPSRPLAEQGLADLDVSLDDFLDDLDLGPEGREVSAAYLAAYNSAESKNVSALHLVRRIAAAGSFAEFVLSGASFPLVEGTAALVAAIAADGGADVVLDTPVQTVSQDGSGVTVVSADREYRASVGVICLPVSVLKEVEFLPSLSEEKLALSVEELACQGTKVWVLVAGAPEGFSGCGRGRGLDMLWVDRTFPNRTSLLVGYGPDADQLDVNDLAGVEKAVRAFLPEVEVLACAGHDWRHDPHARETWPAFRPGQITRYELTLREPEGRLVFGGSHSALRWPGFIDGAIESGFRSAGQADHLLSNGRA